jgi:hypothetical protein
MPALPTLAAPARYNFFCFFRNSLYEICLGFIAEQKTNGRAYDPGLKDTKDHRVWMRGYIFFM